MHVMACACAHFVSTYNVNLKRIWDKPKSIHYNENETNNVLSVRRLTFIFRWCILLIYLFIFCFCFLKKTFCRRMRRVKYMQIICQFTLNCCYTEEQICSYTKQTDIVTSLRYYRENQYVSRWCWCRNLCQANLYDYFYSRFKIPKFGVGWVEWRDK